MYSKQALEDLADRSRYFVTVALAGLGAQAAIAIFVIDRRGDLTLFYSVATSAVALLVMSVGLGAWLGSFLVVARPRTSIDAWPAHRLRWALETQVFLVIVGSGLVVGSAFLGHPRANGPTIQLPAATASSSGTSIRRNRSGVVALPTKSGKNGRSGWLVIPFAAPPVAIAAGVSLSGEATVKFANGITVKLGARGERGAVGAPGRPGPRGPRGLQGKRGRSGADMTTIVTVPAGS